MKKVFSLGVTIHATAYILAKTEEEAVAAASKEFKDAQIQLSDRRQTAGDVVISGERYSPRMPNVSLSPAMTLGAINAESVEMVDDFGAQDDDEADEGEDEDEDRTCGQCEGHGRLEKGTLAPGDDEVCPVCDGNGRIFC